MEKIEIHINLFGAFRDLQSGPSFRFHTYLPISVSDLKKNLVHEFASLAPSKVDISALLQVSAVATEKKVLTDHEIISEKVTLALLPPVCGG